MKTKSDGAKCVTYEEPLSIRVGRFLLSKGYDLSNNIGYVNPIVPKLIESSTLHILASDPEARPKRYLFGLIPRKVPRLFLGTIYFRDCRLPNFYATEQNWVFKMYGRRNVGRVEQLAEELSSTFGVKINITLYDQQSRFEEGPASF